MTPPDPTSSPEARPPMSLTKPLTKPLTTGIVSLALLTALTGCGSDSDSDSGSDGKGSATSSAASGSGSDSASKSLPSAKTLRDVQEFISGAGLPCNNLTDDQSANGTPAEGFLGPSDEHDTPAQAADKDVWGIRKSGFCGETRSDVGGWVIYLPSDMKAFQETYRKQAEELAKDQGWTDLARFFVGADFIIDPTNLQTSKTLLEAGMLLENCDPGFKAPQGYVTKDAQASGCVLTNYLPDPLDQ
ncbi:hypothetical protein [Streptomyces soliscabiei]|uniref:hypothetical protein n=1 Tax=Streptomyces soliscabiei TaxID=588897 RepID=UPI0029B9E864|nr:hypothetical protein [Streptomyces sp. NY05-11A]MDX2679445.1 hypothetical protein [Streptomyces sp. NY05-11A]